MKFETASGSTYEIRDAPGAPFQKEVRRINTSPGHDKRGDEMWVRLISHTDIAEGRPVILEMASLAAYGPDDEGNVDYATKTTIRTTSPVTKIEDGESA